MKKQLILSLALLTVGLPSTYGHDLPPSDVTPHEMLSPREHAELYLNLVSHLYQALITRMDSVHTPADAQFHGPTIIALHRRLNMAIDHMEHNPDMRHEVVLILRNSQARLSRLISEHERYCQSLQRCQSTGLLPNLPDSRPVTLPKEAAAPQS